MLALVLDIGVDAVSHVRCHLLREVSSHLEEEGAWHEGDNEEMYLAIAPAADGTAANQ
jgi:hypothetical protein